MGHGRPVHDLRPLSFYDRHLARRRRGRHRQTAPRHAAPRPHAGAAGCAKSRSRRGHANPLTQMPPQHPTHFVVVGAGAAGLMAAQELARAGKQVTILEARGRCGGRIYPLPEDEFGYKAEGGAEFVHGAAPVTRALMREAQVSLSPRGGTRWRLRAGALSPADSAVPHMDRFYRALRAVKADLPV